MSVLRALKAMVYERCRTVKWLLFLLILIPAIEITVLIGSSHVIGLWSTFAMIVFTGVVGVYLAKRQGFKVLGEIQSKLNRGEMRAAVLDGIFIFVGGILLVLRICNGYNRFYLCYPDDEGFIKAVYYEVDGMEV